MSSSVVEILVRSAWRRRLVLVTAEQLALSLLIVCCGAIVMLLLGTQILAWYWLLVLASIGVGISGWRIQRRLVQRGEVARMIDRRLELHDSLSTAFFLLSESANGDREAVRYQLRQAERIASGITPESAFPMVMSRLWMATAAVMAVMLGLFATRYLVNSSLSLRPALIRLPFVFTKAEAGDAKEKGQPSAKAQSKDQAVRELLAGRRRDLEAQPTVQPQPAPKEQTDPHSEQNANTSAAGKSSQQSPQRPEDGQAGSKNGDRNSEQADAKDSAEEAKPGENSKEANSGQQDPGEKQSKTADGQQTPGLMDKMRDALSGLMAKLQKSSGKDSSSREEKAGSAGQKGQAQQNASNKKQNGTPDQSGQKAENSMDSQSSAQAAAVEKTPASSVGSSNEEMPQSKTNDPQSGAGRQDGQKDLQPAEQLKAMGKLAEIIGKRSANATGEIRVEKPTQEQQLQTQYSNQMGQHSDRGGEINRDEVPPEYQSYVRAYMKEVHKQANAEAK